MMKKLIIFFILISFPICVFAREPKGHQYYEKDYQACWCSSHNGITEYILEDKARVDCVTQTHAIEFDFASKWAESIGQSLYYAAMLHKQPGIVIISERGKKDYRYINRVKLIAEKYGIDLWIITPEFLADKMTPSLRKIAKN